MLEQIIVRVVIPLIVMMGVLVGAIVYIIKKILPDRIEAMSKQLTENDLNHIWEKIDDLRLCDTNIKLDVSNIKADVAVVKTEILGLRRDQDHFEDRVEKWFNEK